MYRIDRKVGVGFAVVGIAGIMLGALVWGNLFTFITGEVGGVGPGFMQTIGFKTDTITVLNSADPGKWVDSDSGIVRWVTLQIWQFTGKMWAEPDGTYSVFWSRHAGVLTNDGKDQLEKQISGVTVAAEVNKYISVSRSNHAPAAGDHILWSEINTGGGLDRAAGTYASTGVGTWTVALQFTADAGYAAVQCTGLCWDDTDGLNGTTLCEDTFAPVTLAASDKITVTFTCSIA
jgi:hypothetical protein